MSLLKESPMKRIVFSILVSILIFFSVTLTSGKTSLASQSDLFNDYSGIGYNSLTMDDESQLTDIKVKKEENSIELQFKMDGEKYNINAKKLKELDEGVKLFTQANVSNDKHKMFNVLVKGDHISGKFVDRSSGIESHSQNKSNGFGFVISSDNTNLEEVIEDAKTHPAIESSIENNVSQLKMSKMESQKNKNRILSGKTNAHVLAQGKGIPGLISSGLSEGWADIGTTPKGPGGKYRDIKNFRFKLLEKVGQMQ